MASANVVTSSNWDDDDYIEPSQELPPDTDDDDEMQTNDEGDAESSAGANDEDSVAGEEEGDDGESVEDSQDIVDGPVPKKKKGNDVVSTLGGSAAKKGHVGRTGTSLAANSQQDPAVRELEENFVTEVLKSRRQVEQQLLLNQISPEEAKKKHNTILANYRKKAAALHGAGAAKGKILASASTPMLPPRKRYAAGTGGGAAPARKRAEPEVVDLSGEGRKKGVPCMLALDATWAICTKTLTIEKGGGRGASFDVLSIERKAKDENAKDFAFDIPIKHLAFVSKALQTILASCPKGPQENRVIPIKEISTLKPDSRGYLCLFNLAKTSYCRTVFTCDNFSIRVEDAIYKSPTGLGSYEALSVIKEYAPKEKDGIVGTTKQFSVSMPVRLIPLMKSAVDYIVHCQTH